MLEGIMSTALGSQMDISMAGLKAANKQEQQAVVLLDQAAQQQQAQPVQAAPGAGKGQVVDITV